MPKKSKAKAKPKTPPKTKTKTITNRAGNRAVHRAKDGDTFIANIIKEGTGTGGPGSRGGPGAYNKPRGRPATSRDHMRSGGMVVGDIGDILREREQGSALRRRLGGGTLSSAFGSNVGLTGSREVTRRENPDTFEEQVRIRERDAITRERARVQLEMERLKAKERADARVQRDRIAENLRRFDELPHEGLRVPQSESLRPVRRLGQGGVLQTTPQAGGGVPPPLPRQPSMSPLNIGLAQSRDAVRNQNNPEKAVSTAGGVVSVDTQRLRAGQIESKRKEEFERVKREREQRRQATEEQRIADEGSKFKIRETRNDQLRRIIATPQRLTPQQPPPVTAVATRNQPEPEPQPQPQPRKTRADFEAFRTRRLLDRAKEQLAIGEELSRQVREGEARDDEGFDTAEEDDEDTGDFGDVLTDRTQILKAQVKSNALNRLEAERENRRQIAQGVKDRALARLEEERTEREERRKRAEIQAIDPIPEALRQLRIGESLSRQIRGEPEPEPETPRPPPQKPRELVKELVSDIIGGARDRARANQRNRLSVSEEISFSTPPRPREQATQTSPPREKQRKGGVQLITPEDEAVNQRYGKKSHKDQPVGIPFEFSSGLETEPEPERELVQVPAQRPRLPPRPTLQLPQPDTRPIPAGEYKPEPIRRSERLSKEQQREANQGAIQESIQAQAGGTSQPARQGRGGVIAGLSPESRAIAEQLQTEVSDLRTLMKSMGVPLNVISKAGTMRQQPQIRQKVASLGLSENDSIMELLSELFDKQVRLNKIKQKKKK